MPNVYLLRHAETTFNVVHDATGEDPLHFDARLSDAGMEQVRAAALEVARLDIDLIVTTPLTRALQTAVGLTRDGRPPIAVVALHRERQSNSCDIGRSPADLAAEFPDLDFRDLPETWWYEGEKDWRGVATEPLDVFEQRMDEFRRWLRSRPEGNVLVVGHGEFFRRLTGVEMRNCELRRWAPEP